MLTASDLGLGRQFNLAHYLVERHVTAGNGGRLAIVFKDRNITYAMLADRVARTAGALARNLKVHKGDRVLLMMFDCPELVEFFLAALHIGAIPVLVNPMNSIEEHQFVIGDCLPRAVIASRAVIPALRPLLRDSVRGLGQALVVGDSGANDHNGEQIVIGALDREPEAETTVDDVAFFIYTSGTTGRPKACVHLHHDLAICGELYGRRLLGLEPTDRVFSIPKLYFSYGLTCSLALPLAVGACTVLWQGPTSPGTVHRLIERYRPTVLFSVPGAYAELLSYTAPTEKHVDSSSLKVAVSAGESLPASLYRRFLERFGVEILDGMGQTESPQAFISNRPGSVRPGSTGQAVPGFEVRIVRADGTASPDGEVGELQVKGDATLAYYWNDRELSEATIKGPWLRTGDLFWRDSDGYYWHAGREDDVFKVNGEWVRTARVEATLLEHPNVVHAAVVCRQDDQGNLAVHACVVPRVSTLDHAQLASELTAITKAQLAAHEVPRWIELRGELPRTSTGKIQRSKLRNENPSRNPPDSTRISDGSAAK